MFREATRPFVGRIECNLPPPKSYIYLAFRNPGGKAQKGTLFITFKIVLYFLIDISNLIKKDKQTYLNRQLAQGQQEQSTQTTLSQKRHELFLRAGNHPN